LFGEKFKTPWISISDMMAGLMMVFLFISVSYSHILKKQSEKAIEESELAIEKNDDIEEIVKELIDYKKIIARDLHEEFDSDLETWGAYIDDDTLSFRFESSDVLFNAGDSTVSPVFEDILENFWPRYLNILNEHSSKISEIKIEGHTSSEWSENVDRDEAYFKNMKLSQDRARNVLSFCYNKTPDELREWAISTITANGFSFSRLKYDESGEEDPAASRRVEFTILVDTESSIDEISESL
jgi:outer membrane protein OmpA-like peptidoglycan-associated protein